MAAMMQDMHVKFDIALYIQLVADQGWVSPGAATFSVTPIEKKNKKKNSQK